MSLPPGVELVSTTSRAISIASDGRSFSFVGTSGGGRMVYVRRLDQFEAAPIRGTDGATTSFFSPDSQSIGFVTSTGELRTVSLAGGLVANVVRKPGR
jgi:hypothetical protein